MSESQADTLNRIEKRAIEAKAIAPLINAVIKRLGREEALAILEEVNQEEALLRGRSLAEEIGRNGIEELVDEVAGWGCGGVWEMDVLEQTPTTYSFNVTRCPYHEKYRELELQEYGVGFSCCRDEPHARGFNPRLRLERTKTLMEGADHCDFRYSLEDPPGDG
ncbi:MAG: L-2-amino-thiazoline-4-carboxylic acid hydrolase [bacterium]|nr:L-2-amino-thiazoline-4-carboxylic acid hydrolase [bacterium]